MKHTPRKAPELGKTDDDQLAESLNRQRSEQSLTRVMQIVIAITVGVLTTIGGKLVLVAGETRDDVKASLFQVAQGTKEREQLFGSMKEMSSRIDKLVETVNASTNRMEGLQTRIGATEATVTQINSQLLDLRERQIKGQETMIQIEAELKLRKKAP